MGELSSNFKNIHTGMSVELGVNPSMPYCDAGFKTSLQTKFTVLNITLDN